MEENNSTKILNSSGVITENAKQEFDQLYNQLMSDKGRTEIGDDIIRQEKIVDKIQQFLNTYPSIIPPDKNPNTPWIKLSLYEIIRRSIQTAIDLIDDISNIISMRKYYGNITTRRQIVQAFTKEERRIYVGIWFIFISFILYFIDSAA